MQTRKIDINYSMQAKLLNTDEIKEIGTKLTGWEISEGKIKRVYKFKNFIDAFAFMTKVALISESMNHHPLFVNVYREVIIELSTHDLNGISNLDVKLANAINNS